MTKSLNYMRVFTLFFSVLLTCSIMAQDVKMRKEGAINVEVSYRMEQLCDYPNQWRNSDWREEFTLMLELSDGQAHSYVVEEQRMLLSALAQFQQENSWHLEAEPIAHLGETFIKGKSLEQLVNLDAAGVYRYTESVPKLKWKVCDEKKKVLDYDCQRATCSFRGREYEAWFTEDIPMSYGPWKFSGLPGLILEVSDTKNEYHFTATGIERPKEQKQIKIPDESFIRPIKRERALKMEALLHKDHGAFAADYGITFTLEGMEHDAMPYHPIELK